MFICFFPTLCLKYLYLTALPLKKPTAKYQHKGYWLKTDNRKDWFINFAKREGFDPKDVDKWKAVSKAAVVNTKVTIRKKQKKKN